MANYNIDWGFLSPALERVLNILNIASSCKHASQSQANMISEILPSWLPIAASILLVLVEVFFLLKVLSIPCAFLNAIAGPFKLTLLCRIPSTL